MVGFKWLEDLKSLGRYKGFGRVEGSVELGRFEGIEECEKKGGGAEESGELGIEEKLKE